MTSTVSAVGFGVLATLILGGAIMMLTSRNVVHSAFWMLETMLATAGLYVLLSYEFLALVQIMVYAGAVAVLILFVIMLTLRRREDAVRSVDTSLVAGVLALAFGALIYVTLLRDMPSATSPFPDTTPDVAMIGQLLFDPNGQWMFPFELASLVLLIALVGAVWWSRKGGDR